MTSNRNIDSIQNDYEWLIQALKRCLQQHGFLSLAQDNFSDIFAGECVRFNEDSSLKQVFSKFFEERYGLKIFNLKINEDHEDVSKELYRIGTSFLKGHACESYLVWVMIFSIADALGWHNHLDYLRKLIEFKKGNFFLFFGKNSFILFKWFIWALLVLVGSVGLIYIVDSIIQTRRHAVDSNKAEEAIELLKQDKYAKAVALLQEGAERNFPKTQYLLGRCYEEGWGVSKNFSEAFKWYKKASNQELPEAKLKTGAFYFYGLGTDQSYDLAFQLISSTSETTPESDCILGMMYFYGLGVDKDYSLGITKLVKAATLGNGRAQNVLGLAYETGIGVAQNNDSTFYYFSLASANGITEARLNLAVCYIEGIGTAVDLDRALELSEEKTDYDYYANYDYYTNYNFYKEFRFINGVAHLRRNNGEEDMSIGKDLVVWCANHEFPVAKEYIRKNRKIFFDYYIPQDTNEKIIDKKEIPQHTIAKRERVDYNDRTSRTRYHVRIPENYSVPELDKIADYLLVKEKDENRINEIWVNYYVKNKPLNSDNSYALSVRLNSDHSTAIFVKRTKGYNPPQARDLSNANKKEVLIWGAFDSGRSVGYETGYKDGKERRRYRYRFDSSNFYTDDWARQSYIQGYEVGYIDGFDDGGGYR